MFILRFTIVVIVICSIGVSQQRKMKMDIIDNNKMSLNYLFFLPEDYQVDKDIQGPVILFLHGMGERGEDLELVKIHGIPKIVSSKKDFPIISV